jgi:hypothetical protein
LSSLGNFSDLAYGNQVRLAEPLLMTPRLAGTLQPSRKSQTIDQDQYLVVVIVAALFL